MRIIALILLILLFVFPMEKVGGSGRTIRAVDQTDLLYEAIGLRDVLAYQAFAEAYQGYLHLRPARDEVMTVIDFTLPSTDKRMVVIDMQNRKVLFHTIVSHGRNSGEQYAKSFSNRHGSYQSSLGFFTTGNTYQGSNGYSLIINGLEKDINDQAKARAVVIHGADYCSEAFIRTTGRLGRSYGCPALPQELNKPIINAIKNGSLLYIYAGNQDYLARTQILKPLSPEQRGLIAETAPMASGRISSF